jgi:hypothetical protein
MCTDPGARPSSRPGLGISVELMKLRQSTHYDTFYTGYV